MESLSVAERAVAEGIADGLRLGEIAKERGTAERTVKNQANRARAKLGVRTLAQVAVVITNARAKEARRRRRSPEELAS